MGRRAKRQRLCGLCSEAAGGTAATAAAGGLELTGQEQQQEQGSGSSCATEGKGARRRQLKRRMPAWADDRPGCWLVGEGEDDFHVQHGDFVFMQATQQHPLAFIVPPHSSSSGGQGMPASVQDHSHLSRQPHNKLLHNHQRDFCSP